MDKLDLANKGAGAVGGAVGAVVGLLGGPAASVLGAMLGSAAADTLKDMATRSFSARELVRLNNATEYIKDGFERARLKGRTLREDGFFRPRPPFASSGAELLEGVLLKCKAQYQERKVQFISNLLANVACDASISAHTAYQLLELVDSLTYDHLCIIAFYGRRDEFQAIDLPIAGLFSYDADLIGEDVMSAARDLLMLIQAGILRHPSSQYLEHTAIPSAKLMLAPRGQMIFDLLDLQYALTYDVETAIKPLEYREAWGLDRDGKRNGRPVSPQA